MKLNDGIKVLIFYWKSIENGLWKCVGTLLLRNWSRRQFVTGLRYL